MRSCRPTIGLTLLVAACTDPETNTVTNTVTVPGETITLPGETITVPDDDLDPGHFLAPLTPLANIYGDDGTIGLNGALEGSMHMDELRYRESDGKLFYCSYTWGVIDASNPIDPAYMAQGYDWDMFESPVGRDTGCLHVDWDDVDGDIVYADHRGNYDFAPHLTAIDLGTTIEDGDEDGIGPADADGDTSDDEEVLAPVFGVPLQEEGISYEGLDYEGGYVFVALHGDGIGVYQYNATTTEMERVGGNDTLVTNAYDIHVAGNTAYVVDENEGLVILDVTDINAITELGRLFIGGVDRDVRYDNGFVYIAAGTPGFAIVDVQDPANPVLMSLTEAYSTVTRIGVHEERVAIAAWTDTRVYDVTDKANPAIIGAVRLEQPQTYDGDLTGERPDITVRTLGVDINGDTLFIGNWDTPHTYNISADRVAPYIIVPEDIFYMSTGTVAVGATGAYDITIRNHGTADLTIYDAWVSNPVFTISPTSVVIPPQGDELFTITYTASADTEETGIVNLLSDDPSQMLRQGYVVGNPSGIGVGDEFPYSEATDVNTLLTWTSDSMTGQVGLVAYFATF